MIKAVLFDMDGLLVDTETVGTEVAVRICRELGIELTREEKSSFVGVTDEKFYKELFEKRNLSHDVQGVLRNHFDVYEDLLLKEATPFPGAQSLPRELRAKGYRLALVSGSTAHQINIILSQLRIKEQFDIIISEGDVVHGKPDPEGYLLAAQRMGVASAECVVLEDATTGIKAAKKAGMRVIGVRNNGDQDLSLADVIVKDLTEVDL